MSVEGQVFTKEKLSRHNGENGSPAFVAYGGLVYDVSRSVLWPKGRHQVTHFAGLDHTDDLWEAPHGEDLLQRFPVVGIMVEDPVAGPLVSEA